ncbi:hypothetical protein Aduo_002547 [Ancylostoma duodenale]
MNINQESSSCCNCMPITKLIYAVFSTTIITHSIVSLIFLFYGQWLILLSLAIIVAAHVVFIIGIRKLSYKLLIVFIVYEGRARGLPLAGCIKRPVPEQSPDQSQLRKVPGIRKKAGILGGVSLVFTIINSAFVWPALRNYLVFLKKSPVSSLAAAAMDPRLFASGGAQTQVPAAAPYPGPMDDPNFSKSMPPPYGQRNHFSVQPYSIYAPLRDPLALGGHGDLSQQFPNQQFLNQQFPNQQYPNPTTNPVYPQPTATSAAPGQFYQQNIALGSRTPGERDMPSQRGLPHGRNTLYDQVAIPLGGTAKDFQYPGSPSPNSSDTDNELPQRYRKTSNFLSNTTSQKYNGYESNLDRQNENPSSDPWESSLYPRSSANPYPSESRAREYGTGLSRHNERERTDRTSAYPRNDRHSRYPSDPDQPYHTRDRGHSPSEIEPLPDY